jgi:hypothetical protein
MFHSSGTDLVLPWRVRLTDVHVASLVLVVAASAMAGHPAVHYVAALSHLRGLS